MRVAILSEFPRTPDRVVGGLESVARELAAGLVRRPGTEVHVVSFHAGLPPGEAGEEEVDGVRVHRFALPARLGNLTRGAAERRATTGRLRAIRPDVVHALGLGPKALAAAASGAAWLLSVNGIQSNEARTLGGLRNRVRSLVLAAMERDGLRRARDVVVPGEATAALVRSRVRPVTRIHVIENPVDERFFGIRPDGDPTRVVCVGRVLPLKAPEDLIEAARILAGEGIAIRIRFVGPPDDPWYLEALRERVRQAGLASRVEFLGFLSDGELHREMAQAGLLVHPSRVEIAPLSVMQAMAAGLPVIATDVGGTARLVDPGRTGLLVPPGQPARLARALAQLRQDPARARRMGEAARREAEGRFRRDRHVDRILEVYRAVAGPTLDSTGSRSRNGVEFREFAHGSGIRKGEP
jgi:glycosyltransferase involved in cell wall biosynthesis